MSCPVDQLVATVCCAAIVKEVDSTSAKETRLSRFCNSEEKLFVCCFFCFSWFSSLQTLLKVTNSQTWEKLYDLTASILGLASCTVELCWTHCVRRAVRVRRRAKTSSRLAWHWPLAKLAVCLSLCHFQPHQSWIRVCPKCHGATCKNGGFRHWLVCWRPRGCLQIFNDKNSF